MRIKTDYHVHPDYSVDASSAKVKDYCERALELGIKEICFTTHAEFGPLDLGNDMVVFYNGKRCSIFEKEWLDSYYDEIMTARKHITSSRPITII